MSEASEIEDADEVTDAEVNAFFGRLALSMRASIARDLLRGNDTQCFTEEQYREAHDRAFPLPTVPAELRWLYTTPADHLRSIPHVVREVAPGVWAATT